MSARKKIGLARSPSKSVRKVPKSSVHRDLVIGLIAPIGVNRKPVADALRSQLRVVDYDVSEVKLSKQIEKFVTDVDPTWLPSKTDYLERKSVLMNVGNAVREYHRGGDAFALLAMLSIAEQRRSIKKKQ